MSGQGFLGNGVASAAIEAFSRILAGELAPSGIRVCLRPDAIPEAVATSHTGEVFRGFAERAGTTVEDMLVERARVPARCWDAFPHSPKSRTTRPSQHQIAPAR